MFSLLLSYIIFSLRTRHELQIEMVALRHQINLLQRSVPRRPRLQTLDRILWVWISRIWSCPSSETTSVLLIIAIREPFSVCFCGLDRLENFSTWIDFQ
jgi:hypothetical protein